MLCKTNTEISQENIRLFKQNKIVSMNKGYFKIYNIVSPGLVSSGGLALINMHPYCSQKNSLSRVCDKTILPS